MSLSSYLRRSRIQRLRSSAAKHLNAIIVRELRTCAVHRHDSLDPEPSLQSIGTLMRVRRQWRELGSGVTSEDLNNLLERSADELLAPLRTPRVAVRRGPLLTAAALLEDMRGSIAARSDSEKQMIILSSDWVCALHHSLLPPERMAVAAGRLVAGGGVRVTASFDVTDASKAGASYVQADRRKMATALLAMEASGSQLAAWMHSHPGAGAGASLPSQIDWNQYADWTRNYEKLLAAIVTGDGYIRFWGDALSRGEVAVRLEGDGLEHVSEHLYKLA